MLKHRNEVLGLDLGLARLVLGLVTLALCNKSAIKGVDLMITHWFPTWR